MDLRFVVADISRHSPKVDADTGEATSGDVHTVNLYPVKVKQDAWESMPAGALSLSFLTPPAAAAFEVGKEVTVSITT